MSLDSISPSSLQQNIPSKYGYPSSSERMTHENAVYLDTTKVSSLSSVPRDSRFEVLRIWAMTAILICHFTAFIPWGLEQEPGWRSSFFITIDQFFGQTGVCIFFILSGFFLIKKDFRWERVAKTITQTFLYSLALLLLSFVLHSISPGLMGEPMQWSRMEIAQRIYKGIMPVFNNQYWFITAYVIRLLFSPFVNSLFTRCSHRQIIFLMTLLASFSLLPFISFCGLKYNGLFWTPATYAVLCYMFGGYLKIYWQAEQKTAKKKNQILRTAIFGCAGFAILFIAIFAMQKQVLIARFFSWAPRSIFGTFPLITIMFTVLIFKSILSSKARQHTNRHDTLVNFFASTVFGVYLIHQNQSIGQLTWILASKVTSSRPSGLIPLSMGSLFIVAVVFITLAFISALFDRIIVHPMQRLLIAWIKKTTSSSK